MSNMTKAERAERKLDRAKRGVRKADGQCKQCGQRYPYCHMVFCPVLKERAAMTNGNRQIRKLATPRVITRGPLQGSVVGWEGAIDGEWMACFVQDRNGTSEQNAKAWLDWKP
jgi:hypothetical protein